MNLKPLLPAAALLVLIMPGKAMSHDHHDFDDANNGAVAQAGSLTPFSSVDGRQYLNGSVDQSINGFDPQSSYLGANQYGNYGGTGNYPYASGTFANNNGNGQFGRAHVHKHSGCNSQRSQMENAMRNNGTYGNAYANPAYSNAMSNINNPAINPFANPANSQYPMNNPYALNNPYAANPYAMPVSPYGNPNASAYNGVPYANPYAYPNGIGYNNINNGFINNATSANNLSRLGSVLSGSGLGSLGSYVQNGSLNGGSLSSLRGLLGI